MKLAKKTAWIAVLTILPATTAWAQGSPETQPVRQVVLTPEMVLELAQADTTNRPDAASPSDAVIEPSPITAITLKSSFFKHLASVMPAAADIDVLLCPTLKTS